MSVPLVVKLVTTHWPSVIALRIAFWAAFSTIFLQLNKLRQKRKIKMDRFIMTDCITSYKLRNTYPIGDLRENGCRAIGLLCVGKAHHWCICGHEHEYFF